MDWLRDGTEVKSSYKYVIELRERPEDSLKLAQEELEKSQKRYKRHYDRKYKPRRLEVGDRVLILLPTDSSKLHGKHPLDLLGTGHWI